jgi:hypothetical protein
MRIDVILLAPGHDPYHIPNAWMPLCICVQEFRHDFARGRPDGPDCRINIAGDLTFALMLSAQARGHTMWYYDVGSLAWEALGMARRARPHGPRP